MKRKLAVLLPLLLLAGCKITDDMGSCEKAALGTLYVLGILAGIAILVGIAALAFVPKS